MVAISIAYCHFACDFVIQCPLRYSHIITFTLLKEIIESMFSDYNGMKLEITEIWETYKYVEIQQQTLSKQWIQEEI